MKPQNSAETKNERDIRRIMVGGTAIGFGFMVASLEALRSSSSGFSFQITWRTCVAFVLGATALVPFWKIVFGLVSGDRTRSRHVWAALLFLLIGVAAFLYPTRYVPSEKLPELYTGFFLAVCTLSLLAGILIVIGRFLEADDKNNQIHSDEIPKE
jgi:hypothetical protein